MIKTQVLFKLLQKGFEDIDMSVKHCISSYIMLSNPPLGIIFETLVLEFVIATDGHSGDI